MTTPVQEESEVRLEDALKNGWIEFFYQPKIDLKRKQLVGLETFARVRHPDFGMLPASSVLSNASAANATDLSELALVSALKTSQHLRDLGILNIRLAVNMQLDALQRLPIAGIAQKYAGVGSNLPLIFDVTEAQVMGNLKQMHVIAADLKKNGFSLAIDDFGYSFLAAKEFGTELERKLLQVCEKFKQLKGGKFAEMKLDRSIVANCNIDENKRGICQNIISLAHSLGSKAVAIGIERKEDLETLEELNCDIGQGYLLGEPMSEEMFLNSIKQRSVKKDKPARKPVAA
jgi:EAL domain-containing protein (putative c-di-GMP-specific phosphodiesterase class I)